MCHNDTLVLQYCLQASIAELASTAATDVGMHGLLASQSCYHYPLVCVHYGPVVDFFITKQTSLHPFDFVRNLFHLLVRNVHRSRSLICGDDNKHYN